MALIKCRECGHEVSDKATTCPQCGAPVATEAVGTPVQTIQQTSKALKWQYAVAGVIFFIGLVWLVISFVYAMHTEQSVSILPIILTIIGAIWGIITKVRIWWHHK